MRSRPWPPHLFIGYQPRHPGMPCWPDFMLFMDWLHPFVGWSRTLWRVADGR